MRVAQARKRDVQVWLLQVREGWTCETQKINEMSMWKRSRTKTRLCHNIEGHKAARCELALARIGLDIRHRWVATVGADDLVP